MSRYFKLPVLQIALSIILLSSSAATGIVLANPTPPNTMQTLSKFQGPFSKTSSPPSDTDAVSPSRIIELANGGYKIINRSGKGSSGTLNDLADTKNTYLADQQIMWDPSSDRFYFSMLENKASSGINNGIAWGFSKTAIPTKASDFCTYFSNFDFGASSFPDHEMLGDSQDFLIIGSNRFSTDGSGDYLGSDIMWLTKPAAGSICPTQSSFKSGIQNFSNSSSVPYSPTAVRQVDNSPTGRVLANTLTGPYNYLKLFSVTKSPVDGSAIVTSQPNVPVPEYSSPPPAPQAGKTKSGATAPKLETLDDLSESYLAFDPRLGHDVIWTSHTVAGGAGSEVRWYEINPSAVDLDQLGSVSDPNLYTFNGSIAPDRLVNGSVSLYGSNAVVNVSTSSPNSYPAIQAVAITGTTQSAMQLIKQSPGPDIDFTCFEPGANYCRWGDYSGASPDPGAPINSSSGRVWSINQWNLATSSQTSVNWRTLLYQSKP